MKIQFHRASISDDEVNAVSDVIRSGWLTMGLKTFEFEEKFRSYVNAPHAIALNSCTAALHLALKVIGVKEGDEVIVPAMTFAATANVVLHLGARPVIVDIERDTHLIDIKKIEENITDKTRAIIPVHYSGQSCDMDEIMKLAKLYGLYVIGDAAHALPAGYRHKMIGSMGDITCFSFYVTKTITTGEGGMAITSNSEWADRMRTLRLHGINRDAWKRYSFEGTWQYDIDEPGYKYNTTDINSAIGVEQLKKIEGMWQRRIEIAQKYNDAFFSLEGLFPYVVKGDRESSWHLYPLRLNLEGLKIDRDSFMNELKEIGISTSVHFIPLYKFSYYLKNGLAAGGYGNCDWVFERSLSLPIYPDLEDSEVDYIIDRVTEILKRNKR